MGEAFIVRRGGSGKAYAAVSVKYPAGSFCTCSNGQKVLKAKDTTGTCLFLLPTGGEWTVTATNGAQTSTKIVTVEQFKTYQIEVSYEFVLYADGNEYTDVTGGWTAYGKSRKNATTIDGGVTSAGGTLDGLMRTANKVDLTKYTSLIFYTESVTGSCIFGVHSNASTSFGSTTYLARTSEATSTSEQSYTVDVSSFTGAYYVSFGNSSSSALRYARVKKVALV